MPRAGTGKRSVGRAVEAAVQLKAKAEAAVSDGAARVKRPCVIGELALTKAPLLALNSGAGLNVVNGDAAAILAAVAGVEPAAATRHKRKSAGGLDAAGDEADTPGDGADAPPAATASLHALSCAGALVAARESAASPRGVVHARRSVGCMGANWEAAARPVGVGGAPPLAIP